jgi:hypothetical protein
MDLYGFINTHPFKIWLNMIFKAGNLDEVRGFPNGLPWPS